MLLWRSDRLQKDTKYPFADTTTRRGLRIHDGAVCIRPLLGELDLPGGTLDLWLEIHNRSAKDRLELTVGDYKYGSSLFVEGRFWSYIFALTVGQRRLLRRLGLIDGKRKCLWLEVWYREVSP